MGGVRRGSGDAAPKQHTHGWRYWRATRGAAVLHLRRRRRAAVGGEEGVGGRGVIGGGGGGGGSSGGGGGGRSGVRRRCGGKSRENGVDARGKQQLRYRCKNVNLVEKTVKGVEDEMEFLFVP